MALIPPLADVEVGEQVRLRRMKDEWVYTVVAVGDHTVQVERRKTVDGRVGEPEVYTWDRKGFGVPEDCVILRLERTSLDVDGRSRPCWLAYISTKGEHYYYWISEEVAVHGLLAIAKELKGRPDEAHAIRWVFDTKSDWR